MDVTIRITKNRFPQAPGLLRQAIARAFASQGQAMLSQMQSKTPVDTGALRASEKVTVTDTSLTLYAGTDHAAYQEFGTHRIPARRFMGSTIDAGVPALVDAIAAEADRGLA